MPFRERDSVRQVIGGHSQSGCTRFAAILGRIVPVLALFVGPGASAFGADGVVGERLGVTHAVPPGGLLEAAMFYLVAGAVVVSALGICFSKNIVRMAVWLFGSLASVAILYFLLAANFLGAIQLIVYVGGTLVLLIFGVMLTSQSPWVRFGTPLRELAAATIVCLGLFVCLVAVLAGATWAESAGIVQGTSIAAFGRRLLTTYLVPFEVAGVLLFIVMVGAAHLARPEK